MSLEPTPGIAPPGFSDHAFNAPTQRLALHAGANPHLYEVRVPEFRFRADKPFTRGNQLAGGGVILEPFWERPAGPKHTRAEQVES